MAVVSAVNNLEVLSMIAEAMKKVGRESVATLEEGKLLKTVCTLWNSCNLNVVIFLHIFVIDNEKMYVEYENCKIMDTAYLSQKP
ncbi:hypothetical protein L1987_30104 [Smallanthus sonchifolius]|uniref:Uncharacterized protein n=1 Tax=Smallanthus sonchifolius TaxID=185202 RepID=A0ACB9I1A4_9ASTR|nr:hypothetical protein L1987_30104 [Smallanthus sonchifolius]